MLKALDHARIEGERVSIKAWKLENGELIHLDGWWCISYIGAVAHTPSNLQSTTRYARYEISAYLSLWVRKYICNLYSYEKE